MRLFSYCLASLAALSACRSQPADPAPPPARYELTVAPPGARGARAGGTDAAPPVPSEGTLEPEPTGDGDDEAEEPEEQTDGGVPGDAGAAPPTPGVAL